MYSVDSNPYGSVSSYESVVNQQSGGYPVQPPPPALWRSSVVNPVRTSFYMPQNVAGFVSADSSGSYYGWPAQQQQQQQAAYVPSQGSFTTYDHMYAVHNFQTAGANRNPRERSLPRTSTPQQRPVSAMTGSSVMTDGWATAAPTVISDFMTANNASQWDALSSVPTLVHGSEWDTLSSVPTLVQGSQWDALSSVPTLQRTPSVPPTDTGDEDETSSSTSGDYPDAIFSQVQSHYLTIFNKIHQIHPFANHYFY